MPEEPDVHEWADCAAACKGRGLEEPWAKLDAQALAGPPSNASVLELSFADSSGFKPLRIALRPDLRIVLRPVFVALEDHVEWGHAFTVWGEMHDAAGLATLEATTRLPCTTSRPGRAAPSWIMRLLDAELPATAAIVSSAERSDLLTESRDRGTAADAVANCRYSRKSSLHSPSLAC